VPDPVDLVELRVKGMLVPVPFGQFGIELLNEFDEI
jgi:hypothetical protein